MSLKSFYEDKVILISGGTSGLGKELVRQLLTLKAKVSTFGRDKAKVASLKNENNPNLLAYEADITSKKNCKKAIDNTLKTFGRIDILINNAGISMKKTFLEVGLDVFEKIIEINFYGAVRLTHASLPHLIKTKGIVSSVSSVAGLRGIPGRTGYCSSKFALNGFMESLRIEMIQHGVDVIWFSPGFFSSEIRNRLEENKERERKEKNENNLLSSKDCATIIIKKIYKRKRHTVITFLGKLTFGLNKFMPSIVDKMVFKRYYNSQGDLIQ